ENSTGSSQVMFSPDGTMLAAAGYTPEIRLWDLATKQVALTLKQRDPASNIAFSPDDRTLASTSTGNPLLIKLWDMPTDREIANLLGHGKWITGLSFSPDGKILASCSHDNTVKLWDLNTSKELATLKGHTDFVSAVSFSPDGKRLASAG